MNNIKKILVVCTGNACRSPMAEGFLRKDLSQGDGFIVKSAGTSAVDGVRPTPYAVDVMKDEGVDISGYLSSALSNDFLKAADLILVMAKMHKDAITETTPELKEKVYLYNDFASLGRNADIIDPIGQPLSVYKDVCNQIKEATLRIAITNTESAKSRILDSDMAFEQLESTRLQILQQTATAQLAQANVAPQNVLALFQ